MTEKTIAQAAREAADLIRRTGWVQNGVAHWKGDELVGMCIGGALNAALYTEPVFGEEEGAWTQPVLHVLREQYPDYPWVNAARADSLVVNWNDDPDRTKDEVLAILEKLAAQE
jgi:hypothetical protein